MGISAGIGDFLFGAADAAAVDAAGIGAADLAATGVADAAAAGLAGDVAAGAILDPALVAASEAALPEAVGEAAAGTLAYAPVATDVGALIGTAADYAGSLAPGAVSDAGLAGSVGSNLTGAAADYTAGLAGSAPSALTPAVTGGLGSAASSAVPAFAQESIAPLTETAAASDLSYLPIQTTAEGLPVTAGDAAAGAGALGSSGTAVGDALASGTAAEAAASAPSLAAPATDLSYLPIQTSASGLPVAATNAAAGAGALGSSGTAIGDTLASGTSLADLPAANAVNASANLASQSPFTLSQPFSSLPTMAQSPLAPAADALSQATGTAGEYAATVPEAAAQAGGDGLLSDIGSYLMKNPSLALSGVGLAANLLRGQQKPEYSAQLEAQAQQLQQQGAQLSNYLSSGTLPPGIGAALQSAHDSGVASIRAMYANRGMSGSSAEMQDIANLNQATVSQGASIASQLLQTGVSEQQFASGLYQNLMAVSMQQDAALSNAIGGFTNALAGGYAKTATPVG